jgi:putative transcriptional regulator
MMVINMNIEKLAESLKEVSLFSEGKLELKVTTIVPPRIDVKQVRAKVNLSQKEFADHYGFTVAAIRNWEQGIREPEGPTRTLLALIEQNPALMEREIQRLRIAA